MGYEDLGYFFCVRVSSNIIMRKEYELNRTRAFPIRVFCLKTLLMLDPFTICVHTIQLVSTARGENVSERFTLPFKLDVRLEI